MPPKISRHALPLAWAAMLALGPLTASAACYSIYDAKNAMVYQSSTSPIDLSYSVSEQMAARFPSRALVISTLTSCAEDIRGTAAMNRYTASSADVGRDSAGEYGTATSAARSPGTDVNVRGYQRDDGTSVQAHTRSSARR